MKKTISFIAFAALLAPSPLPAETVEVTFDAALTNTTGWVYSDKILLSSDGSEHIYFRSIDSYVKSQQFSFNVTSITIRLSCSSANATRHLQIGPTSDIGQQTADVAEKDKQESQTFLFDAASNMRSFLISLKGSGGTGYWHVYSAAISGVPIVTPPGNLRTGEVKGTRFSLSWDNPAEAVSNRIDVATVQRSESTGQAIEVFGFDEISARGNPAAFDDFRKSLPERYAKLSGEYLYAATNSTGLLQISTGKSRGLLVHSGFDSYADLTLCMTLKRYGGDADTMTVAWTDGGAETNLMATVALSDEFNTEFIDLSKAADNARIVFNNSGNDDKHRVIIDEISFIRGYVPATVETNLVKSVFAAQSPATARGLNPNTEYIVSVSAFDAEGNGSKPSDPIKVTTGDDDAPLSVIIR